MASQTQSTTPRFFSRPDHAVLRLYDAVGNAIETQSGGNWRITGFQPWPTSILPIEPCFVRQPPEVRRPSQTGCLISEALRLRVTSVVNLNAFREQTLATALPTARQRGTARLCLHTRTKSMLAFARSLRWLVSPFHKTEK
jgi:hypothetical protein